MSDKAYEQLLRSYEESNEMLANSLKRVKALEGALKESLSILEQTLAYRENAKLTGGNIFLTSTIEKVKQLLTH